MDLLVCAWCIGAIADPQAASTQCALPGGAPTWVTSVYDLPDLLARGAERWTFAGGRVLPMAAVTVVAGTLACAVHAAHELGPRSARPPVVYDTRPAWMR